MASLGSRLAYLRMLKGLSQADLARRLNMGQSTIAMYERDRRSPDLITLVRLADFFGVTTDFLLGRQEAEKAGDGVPAELSLILSDPAFGRLLRDLPALSEEERQSLAAHWEWAMQVILKEKERRSKRSPEGKNVEKKR